VGLAQTASPFVQVLTIPADLGEVGKVRSLVEKIGAASHLPPEQIFDIQVATSEACANAIEHGKSEVQVQLWRVQGQVIAEVSNVGEFRPRPRHEEQAAQRRLFLLRVVRHPADLAQAESF